MSITTTTTLSPATVPYDLARAKSVIAYWTHVRVRDIAAEIVSLAFGEKVVESIQVTVTATTTRDARRLAMLLDLPAEAPDPAMSWRTWTGWVSEISTQRPVLVRVTAPTGALHEAS